ncbi:hypothetical protein BVRB_4g073180 [Beta vulgaris subsp. vulgaris]|uniref:glucan endo-1,3-beta-glucosidase n=1 Tax=Beta vulgaris subsp. vulgaris TaxID=3555 RepID=UPI00053FB141|nr:glucan endo-1,3-beta-glucosidase [Beta vulgaris subsp. vulgaris]KMT14548.1 hypothetical protein BVRB_4g073180 [Beta vulgaris subsp. vulgaris]
MATTSSLYIAVLLLLSLHPTDAQIGVCYGRNAKDLPCAEDVVNLYDFHGIQAMRLYEPDQTTLEALQGTWITLMLGVRNEEISSIASDQSTADKWVRTNVVPYASSIKYIAVGNEIHPSDQQASSVKPAMQNLLNALNSNNLGNQIKVSTVIDTSLITNSYPPSHAQFINLTYITPIINFLATNDSPLLVNIQPYTSYINDPKNIKLDYALFNAQGTVFIDDKNGLKYQNLFDAIYDAILASIDKVVTSQDKLLYNGKKTRSNKKKKVKVVVSESGWPSKGGFSGHSKKNNAIRSRHHDQMRSSNAEEAATTENAKTYYTNLIAHVKNGTPLTPGEEIETYLFAMFDEVDKPGDESERHFGVFTPDEQPKYGQLDFCYC